MTMHLYRFLLRLLPAELRRKHGNAMEVLFVREVARARRNGFTPATVAALAGMWDVVQQSAYELTRMQYQPAEGSDRQLPTTRKLLRGHALSFGVAFGLLTVALILPFATRQISVLSARGASTGDFVQLLLLAVPFTAAMTIPMAVLTSVLYEFTKLGANGTLALARQTRAGMRQIVLPVVLTAAGVALLSFVVTAEMVPRANARLANVMAGRTVEPGGRSMTLGALRAAAHRASANDNANDNTNVVAQANAPITAQAVSYEVEFQKKLALPAACLILALAGIALAFRMPRGGTWLVFGASVVVFGAYYVLIMGGEALADQHVVSPFVGMWGANLFVLIVAFLASRGLRRQPSNARGKVVFGG